MTWHEGGVLVSLWGLGTARWRPKINSKPSGEPLRQEKGEICVSNVAEFKGVSLAAQSTQLGSQLAHGAACWGRLTAGHVACEGGKIVSLVGRSDA